MTIDTQQFYRQLPLCQCRDRAAFERRLQKLEQRLRNRQPADRMAGQLAAAMQDSVARVEERARRLTRIDFPELPVSARRDEIARLIADNQVVVVAGETGSGKTTQLPKICLDLGLGRRGLIGHTQPRRLAARTVANRIAEELHSPLGDIVGYQVRFTEQVSEQSLLKLMTDGILLAETQRDPLLERYEVIIVDEAHERSLNIDFLLGYLKRLLPRRPDLKLIITSATIDLERFSQHFDDAPIIEVSGRTYPVEVLYRPLTDRGEDERDIDQQQAILEAVDEIGTLERQQKKAPGDILVFLSGEREIRETAETLRRAQLRDTEVMPLYARLSLAEQNRVFEGGRRAGRRIVLATNVAETSVTVPGIRYVIDPGQARISRYSYRAKVQRLPIEPVSRASANQRAGRCGRVAEGICIRLYSEEDFAGRSEFTDAEIRRTNLAAVILQMLSLRLGDIADFPFIDPPDSRFVNDGYKLLEELGAVDDRRRITGLGRQLSKLPVDPRIGRMVLEGATQGALREVLIVASALSSQDPRERPLDKQQAADEKHRQYADDESDFVTLLNLWTLYEEQRQELSQNQLRKYCQKHFLSFLRMREWRDVHRQLHLIARQLDLAENREPATAEALHRSLLAGLLSQIGMRQENREYLGARNRRFYLFPASTLFKKAPKWVMSAELVETSKLYARMNAAIKPEWVEPLAGHLVKRTYLEPHWEKKRAQVVASEQVTLYGLIVVPKRKVHYGKIDPEVSHEIFIRSALVEGAFSTKGEFFAHNRRLLAGVEDLEAKSRRRDLLVDEDSLYDFYFERMEQAGGAGVVNGAGFEHWRKAVEQDNPRMLFMTEDDVLQRSAGHVTARDYPERLRLDSVELRLHYHFEPGAPDDGVTLDLPLALLNGLSERRLDWLVPGMLEEKCIAILKGLPKQQRKHFVPIPDYVRAFVERAVFADGDLYEALSHHLRRMNGVLVEPAALRDVPLDSHHRMNLRLLDEHGKRLGEGRDLADLTRRFGKAAEAALRAGPGDQWGRSGILCWDFGELPETVSLRQAGGIKVDAYPALRDCGDCVELHVCASPGQAQQESRLGIARLAQLELAGLVRQVRRDIPNLNESLLYIGSLFDKAKLSDAILQQAMMQLLALDESLPRDEQSFRERLNGARAGLWDKVMELAAFVYECHRSAHRIRKSLGGRIPLQAATVLNDIKTQLGELIDPEYLIKNSGSRLQHFPRYLAAIEKRLEKYQRDLQRERLLSDQLQHYWSLYKKQSDKNRSQGVFDPALEDFRWMLEEYRVSLFAQTLGTRVTVSDKRIQQLWRELQR
ncbi:ATP-dependent helicase [Marinobacterium nitratireducens]|uniref:RNA helicase n=1 Tax=Marinobacterium nitratireducens TaxID=518897 RepID=A0A918DRI0_9GAMM|nr:ATP-dependent RNA helicase HrpA [Marinobacterium nitratireducens]GGO81147.1 ATP-dependent helicase [Marinobacterium nitratireducens]